MGREEGEGLEEGEVKDWSRGGALKEIDKVGLDRSQVGEEGLLNAVKQRRDEVSSDRCIE
jgi:hypothetical protein